MLLKLDVSRETNERDNNMSENTLGLALGVVDVAYTVEMANGDKLQISNKFDCSSLTDIEVRSYVMNSLKIKRRVILKKLTNAEVLETSGDTILAANAGKKILSRQEQMIAELLSKVGGDEAKLAQMLEIANGIEVE